MKGKLITSFDHLNENKNCVYLFERIWMENTTLLLQGTHKADKTSTAVDIALKVASTGREVVYVDTQHCLRDHAPRLATRQNIFVFKTQFDGPEDTMDYADMVISSIEEIITHTGMKVFIVDSITRIAGLSFGRNASVSYIMKRLVTLQMRYGVSLLVIAHNSTKATERTIACLADSCMEIAEPQPSEPSFEEVPEPLFVTEPQQTATPLSRKQRRARKRLVARATPDPVIKAR